MIRASGYLLAAALAGLAAPASAGQYQLPAQCQAHLTMQARGCLVSHFYRCEGDAEGDQWRADIGAEGPFFVSRTDAEGQWVVSEDLLGGFTLRLNPNPADPASLTALFDSGFDSYEFSRSLEGVADLTVKGFDRLTGHRVTIDEVELEETIFEYRETGPDGEVLTVAKGREYVHRDWRLFFSGEYETEEGAMNRSPARFDMPGDKGFLTDTPEYDCTDQMAGAQSRTLPMAGLTAPLHMTLAASAAPAAARPKE